MDSASTSGDGPAAGSGAGAVVTLGNFDGVHLGHAALLREALACATRLGGRGARPQVKALAFARSPQTVLRPGAAPVSIMPFEHRAELLRSLGADEVVAIEPTPELLSQTPEAFIRGVKERYGVRAIVEGSDFRFGKGREGDTDTLRRLGDSHGFETVVVGPVAATMSDLSLAKVSSTLIRWLLERGRVRDAAACLGRPHEIEGFVVRGAQRGRTLGMHTANLDSPCMAPMDGVYAAFAERPDGSVHPAALSVGTNPQFGGAVRTVEAHLLGWNGALDDYGWRLRLRLIAWLRGQQRFESVDALVAQMRRDCDRAAHTLAHRDGATVEAITERIAAREGAGASGGLLIGEGARS